MADSYLTNSPALERLIKAQERTAAALENIAATLGSVVWLANPAGDRSQKVPVIMTGDIKDVRG